MGEYVGGYTDWIRQRPVGGRARPEAKSGPNTAAPVVASAPPPSAPRRKLGFKEARELEALPARIEALEGEVARLTSAMSEPAFYSRDAAGITAHNVEMARVQAELDAAYARWAELDG